jgi:phosphoribosylglycinamide formyltransferase-1
VLAEEHRLYPQAVRWFLDGRLHLGADGTVKLDAARVPQGALTSPSS